MLPEIAFEVGLASCTSVAGIWPAWKTCLALSAVWLVGDLVKSTFRGETLWKEGQLGKAHECLLI